ncbi:AAA ATPase [Deinococcus phoenicis]|uniref:AAA ATPase n=1 Tax=Deinococcus phoenicis TaxID=1476583 RepID=A0A016QLZ2_9DEIO|nr:ATP-binding protein [Deinococcus phoenicis]EYB66814.1 AAA ATPase [Deinococcus phoenicis]
MTEKRAAVPAVPEWTAARVTDALQLFLDALDTHLSGEAEPGASLDNPLDDGGSRFSQLCEALSLGGFERAVLMLALIAEVHPLRFRHFAQAQYDPAELPPPGSVSRHLALSLFDGDPTALADDAPLLHWRLLSRPAGVPGHSLAPLSVDPAVLAYVYGDDRLNPRLNRYVQHLEAPAGPLAHSAAAHLPTLAAHLHADERATAQLHGRDVSAQLDLAAAALSGLGVPLLRLSLGTLLGSDEILDRDLRLWERETRLRPLALCLDASEADLDLNPEKGSAAALERRVASVAAHLHAPLVLLTTEPLALGSGRPVLNLEVTRPTRAEQRGLWASALGLRGEDAPRLRELTDQFDLNASALRDLAGNVRLGLSGPGLSGNLSDDERLDRAWEACRVAGRRRIGTLAERLTGTPGWDDVILPDADLAVLHGLVEHVRHRTQVYETWGMGRHARGLGISALFSGPSGTGKTLAAEVIANELRLDLYRIDLSSMVSKYIGETEKNLKSIFDAADDGGVILLFDEADSLFGKRGDVQSANDRYANTQVNYLLQRMESYAGLALLTTNLESGMDTAFMRRIRFVLNFRAPEAPERERIWRRAFPPQVDVSGVDFARLARVKLAGGNIRSVALGAAFLAAARREPLSMALLREAIRAEWRKLGRVTLDAAAFADW